MVNWHFNQHRRTRVFQFREKVHTNENSFRKIILEHRDSMVRTVLDQAIVHSF